MKYSPDQLRICSCAAPAISGLLESTACTARASSSSRPPDVIAPTAKALVSSGRRGRMLKLFSALDDSGDVSVVEQVKLARKTVATIVLAGFVSTKGSKTVATLWKVLTSAAGAYQHCVRVTDRAGQFEPAQLRELVLEAVRGRGWW